MHELMTVLYYMAPMCNARFISLMGIQSFNSLRSLPELTQFTNSIADPFVNERRDSRKIGSRTLHDYVPLYWATHTPMQHVVTRRNHVSDDDIVFFVVSANEVLAIPGVFSTDGNAASHDTKILPGNEACAALDPRILRSRKCFSPDYKRKKCAEVLVPDEVDKSYFLEISVASADAADRLRSEIAKLCRVFQGMFAFPQTPIVVRREFYFDGAK